MKPVLFDGFALVNLALWGLGAQFLFRRPLAFHRAELSFAELLLYGGVVAAAGILLWTRLRRVSWRPALLALVEIALLSSIAGFVVAGDGTRLYDRTWMSIPVDKLVHFACAAVAAIGVGALFAALGMRPARLEGLFVVLVVLGGGAAWEIVEYLVKTAFTDVGVGAHDNNMQDLVANLLGSLAARALPARIRHVLERVEEH
jgi:hypothetical protein